MRHLGLLFALGCLGFTQGQCSSSEMLAQYGYTELRPPSSLLQVGSLVAIDQRSPFQARIICGAEASLGPHLATLKSVTTNGSIRHLNNRSFTLDGKALQFNEIESLKSVHSVTAKIRNARIVELTDEAVLVGMQYRSPECARAVRSRVEKGYTITMISSALICDIEYSVDFQHSMKTRKDAKSEAVKDLAVMLEGEFTSIDAGEIHAKGLVMGIRDDEYLSALSIPGVAEQKYAHRPRHIPMEQPAVLQGHDVALIEAPAQIFVEPLDPDAADIDGLPKLIGAD